MIRTDHQALKCILDLNDSRRRFARWRLPLLEFDSEAVHLPRMYHQGVDIMSRHPKERTEAED